ncbi:nuclear pore component-domain-containing protein [Cristinia sonorae]|uniref:Nuclear pore component-domain-containing protein n=1 Tax=Cristinia sonorae TaxID=1940300 RepID=A0A8K0UYE2_9AGAR|nr:nuclear pore component-domain-containing protein [Cristinia sonorae]
MDTDEDWSSLLQGHPILSLPKSVSSPVGKGKSILELSHNTLPDFTSSDPESDEPTPSGRRQVMVIKDSDLILAAGSEIRIASLGDAKLHRNGGQTHKVLHTPNVTFEIHSMTLNPNAKLLAVAGAYQVAVVVLPRPGFTRLVPSTVDCKSIQIGQYYHAAKDSPPIAKIEWHPWGEGGTTLMVMTTDGKMREYDISQDTEEPQQILSFVPEKKSKSFLADDSAEREVASFSLGKGKADWGPLSLYALMKSGDIYSICPYMPKNASIPSSYIHALECFVHAKKEFLSRSALGESSSTSLSTLYEYQHKYVSALLKQLPPGTAFPATSRPVSVHPPLTIKAKPIRQGPFLLQPAPRNLEGSEGEDATDILYLAFGGDGEEEEESDTERLGVVLVAFQDGKVDVCLDVEKVEAKWEHRQHPSHDLPMLAVYETIDLGTITMLKKASSAQSSLDLLQGSHPVFLRDPIQDETVYVYHAFGVHAVHLAPLLQALTAALRDDNSNDGDDDRLRETLEKASSTLVQPVLATFSVERSSSNPVIGVAIPNDVYLTYSIFILTSAMRLVIFPLSLHSDPPPIAPQAPLGQSTSSLNRSQTDPKEIAGPPLYISLLHEPYVPDTILTRPLGPRLALPQSGQEVRLTPETLRFLTTQCDQFMNHIKELQVAYNAANMRASMQQQEFRRQQAKCQEMVQLIGNLSSSRQTETKEKIQRIKDNQKQLMDRMEKILRVFMKSASPELSEHETKWFDELKRMKQEVMGAKRYDAESLENRAAMLRRELDRMLPNLKELHEKEERIRKKLADHQENLGVSQAFELGERSNAERAKISSIEDEICKLAEKLYLNVGRPPSLNSDSRTSEF